MGKFLFVILLFISVYAQGQNSCLLHLKNGDSISTIYSAVSNETLYTRYGNYPLSFIEKIGFEKDQTSYLTVYEKLKENDIDYYFDESIVYIKTVLQKRELPIINETENLRIAVHKFSRTQTAANSLHIIGIVISSVVIPTERVEFAYAGSSVFFIGYILKLIASDELRGDTKKK